MDANPPKAELKILFDMFWSPRGWRDNRQISPGDFSRAKSAGIMFDPVDLTAAEILDWRDRALVTCDPARVAHAFVASLGTRRLDRRSALGSYAAASSVHRFVYPANYGAINGELNVLNFERFKWGGVRAKNPLYQAFDLSEFERFGDREPTPSDFAILGHILEAIRSVPPTTKGSALERVIKDIFVGTKNERIKVLETFTHCGILVADPTRRWSPPHTCDIDWALAAWRGIDGVREDAVRRWFPEMAG